MITDKTNLRDGISLAEFFRLYQQQHLEIINGRIFYQEPQGFLHAVVSHNIYHQMRDVVTDIRSKDGLYMRMVYVISKHGDLEWVHGARKPDLSFYVAGRLTEHIKHIDIRRHPPFIAPDLAIEVLSASDTDDYLTEKISVYWEDGVKQIWLIDPEKRGALVYTPDANRPIRFDEDGVLSAPDIVPNFELALSKIWA